MNKIIDVLLVAVVGIVGYFAISKLAGGGGSPLVDDDGSPKPLIEVSDEKVKKVLGDPAKSETAEGMRQWLADQKGYVNEMTKEQYDSFKAFGSSAVKSFLIPLGGGL